VFVLHAIGLIRTTLIVRAAAWLGKSPSSYPCGFRVMARSVRPGNGGAPKGTKSAQGDLKTLIALLDNPPVRFLAERSEAQSTTCKWWIAHTKSRFEKSFAWDLVARDISYFLPMVEGVTLSGGRRRKLLKPLFPSYVFFNGDADARVSALETGRLCQVLAVPDQALLEREIASLQLALEDGHSIDPYPFAAIGRQCRVTGGTLRGLEGVIVERSRTAKVVLQVTMLGRGALLEIDPGLLEIVD
jgi:hypothetical protein